MQPTEQAHEGGSDQSKSSQGMVQLKQEGPGVMLEADRPKQQGQEEDQSPYPKLQGQEEDRTPDPNLQGQERVQPLDPTFKDRWVTSPLILNHLKGQISLNHKKQKGQKSPNHSKGLMSLNYLKFQRRKLQ